MYYQWEWLSDLAIIPAGECFLAGIAAGAVIVGIIWWRAERRRK